MCGNQSQQLFACSRWGDQPVDWQKEHWELLCDVERMKVFYRERM